MMTEEEQVKKSAEPVVISKEERRIFELNAICLDSVLTYIKDTQKIIEQSEHFTVNARQADFLEYDTLILNSLMDRFIRIEKLVKESIND